MNTKRSKTASPGINTANKSEFAKALSRNMAHWLCQFSFVVFGGNLVNLALCLVDTVRIRFPFRFDDYMFRAFLRYSCEETEDRFLFYCYSGNWETSLGAVIKIMYFPRRWDGQSYLVFEFSVPKVVLGANYRMIEWGTDVIARLQEELAPVFEALGIEPLNILDGIFSRLDISVNLSVGDKLPRWIDLIKGKVFPRWPRTVNANPKPVDGKAKDEDDNGIVFKTKTKRLTFYDKFAECGHALSSGILRLELSLRSTTDVARIFGFNRAQVRDLSPQLLLDELQKFLAELTLDRPTKGIKHAEEKMVEMYGYRASTSLVAFLAHEKNNPGLDTKDLADRLGISVSTVNKHRKQIKALPIGVAFDTEIELPALCLPTIPGSPMEPVIVQSRAEKDSNTCDSGEIIPEELLWLDTVEEGNDEEPRVPNLPNPGRSIGSRGDGDAAKRVARSQTGMDGTPDQDRNDGQAGTISEGNEKDVTRVRGNTSPTPGPIIIGPAPIDCPDAFEMSGLASALFGRPAILVSSPCQESTESRTVERVAAYEEGEIYEIFEDLWGSENPFVEEPESPPNWLLLDDDYLIARFLSRNPQPEKLPPTAKGRRRR